MTVVTAAAPGRSGAAGGPSRLAGSLAGTRELARLAFRRDRTMLPVWVYLLTIIAGSGGYGLKTIYKTTADRASLEAAVHRDAALSFLYGQLHGSTLGDLIAWRYLSYAALGAGLMTIFLVVRHTRADEESGRLELVGSTAVGRHAALAVAMLVASAGVLALFVLTTVVLAISGQPLGGSVAFALGEAGGGLVFAAIAAVAAQVASTARGARGIAITVLAVTFFFRGVGDSSGSHGLGWLDWLSPIGWAELLRPFADERWWVLALFAAATAAGTYAAFALAAHRDLGAGLVQPGPGPATAGRLLAGPAGLSWRLLRGALAGWSVGFLAGGLAIGVVAESIRQLIGASGEVDKALRQIGGQSALTNAYLASCMSLFGLMAAAYAVSATLRLRSEETAERAEPLLAAAVSRRRWAGSHLAVVAGCTAVTLLAAGLGVGIGYGLASSDVSGQVPGLLGAGLVQVPAALAVAAVAVVAIGVLPRWSRPVGWAALAVCGFIGIFGPALNLSQGVLDVSPFTHVPRLPGGAFSVTPLAWLCAAVLVMTAAGLAGLRRRDIG